MSDYLVFWYRHFQRPTLEPSLLEQILYPAPRNRHEIRAALAQHRRRWKGVRSPRVSKG
jgi:hypothetical protein